MSVATDMSIASIAAERVTLNRAGLRIRLQVARASMSASLTKRRKDKPP
jgi:hypothetical protein